MCMSSSYTNSLFLYIYIYIYIYIYNIYIYPELQIYTYVRVNKNFLEFTDTILTLSYTLKHSRSMQYTAKAIQIPYLYKSLPQIFFNQMTSWFPLHCSLHSFYRVLSWIPLVTLSNLICLYRSLP